MSDSDEGKIGDGKKGKTDPKSLPADAIQLLQMQTAQNMDVMHELVRQMSRLKTKGTGGGGGGDSNPESSDSFNEDGMPKMRGPMYYERQKRKTQRAIKRINPPVFKGEPGERPEAHLLCTLDWYDAISVLTDRAKLKNFRHTLIPQPENGSQTYGPKELQISIGRNS